MKAAETPSKKLRDTTPIILRLERNNTEILSLTDKLNSYVCEPKTQSLFERMESLRHRLDKMRNANIELINLLKEPRKAMDAPKEKIKKLIKEFKELENNVFEYIGMARMHC